MNNTQISINQPYDNLDNASNYEDISGFRQILVNKPDTVGASLVKNFINTNYDLSGSKIFIVYGEATDLREVFDLYLGMDPSNTIWMEGNIDWYNDINKYYGYKKENNNLFYGIVAKEDNYEDDDLYTIDSFIYDNNIIASTLNVWYVGRWAPTEIVFTSGSNSIKYAQIILVESIKDASGNSMSHNMTETNNILKGYGFYRIFANYTYDIYVRP